MVQLVLGIGSNCGKRLVWLDMIREEVGFRLGTVSHCSGIVESAPWGYQSQNWFLNQVIVVETVLSPKKVLATIHGIESGFGRIRMGEYADRNADIDILFYDDQVFELPGLTVPHPKFADRRFVMMPLAQVLPDFRDPLSGESMSQLLVQCRDTGECHWFTKDQSSDLLP